MRPSPICMATAVQTGGPTLEGETNALSLSLKRALSLKHTTAPIVYEPCYGPVWWPGPTTPYVRSSRFENDHERTTCEALPGRQDLHAHAPLHTFRRRSRTHARRCPVWPRRPTHSRTARNVPRTSTNARLGEALSGSQDLHAHAPLHTFRERPRTHAWPKPCLAGTTYTLMHRSQRSESDDEPTHGRSPVWPQRPTTPGPLAVSRERSGTHAWAKPCLAGRPTMLVRTQSPEQNTSRGRPSGMELPDYPVVATRPIPQDQDGPTPPLPTGSFPYS
jgi:hypothetical protein